MQAGPSIDFTQPTVPQLHEWLRGAIIRGELPPAARLSETEIGNRLGVSRQPVREAFIRLTAEGLTEVRPQRGTYVSPISLSAVLSARLIREAVESDLVRMLAETADDALLDRLDAEIDQQRDAVSRQDVAGFVALDDRFHRLLAEAAGHEAVWQVLEGLKSQMNRLRHISARAFDTGKLIAQHQAIVQGLRARDPAQAEAAMRRHLRELLIDMPEIASAHPEIFAP